MDATRLKTVVWSVSKAVPMYKGSPVSTSIEAHCLLSNAYGFEIAYTLYTV